jgi:hypothetical protein
LFEVQRSLAGLEKSRNWRWIMNRKQLLRNLIAVVVALGLTAGYMVILEEATLYYGEPANATVAPGSARTVG